MARTSVSGRRGTAILCPRTHPRQASQPREVPHGHCAWLRHTLITTVPIIANAIDPPLSRSLIARLMDAQRGFLRPLHELWELDGGNGHQFHGGDDGTPKYRRVGSLDQASS
jgi:hypothetical protein